MEQNQPDDSEKQHIHWHPAFVEALKIAKNMIKQELPFETIVSATQLDPEKVKELYQ